MSERFLDRWSQRKLAVQQGQAVEAEPLPVTQDGAAEPGAAMQPIPTAPSLGEPGSLAGEQVMARTEAPLPTLEDVADLTPESDFRRFAARGVAPEVKNAAMKKLFADPRFNMMDGLDVYTGDYSQADPMPESMLRQLASAGFLRLFEEQASEPKEASTRAVAREVADNPEAETVAHSQTQPTAASPPPDHADAHLQLQPDPTAPGEDPGAGAG